MATLKKILQRNVTRKKDKNTHHSKRTKNQKNKQTKQNRYQKTGDRIN
jgi:hypothetical protein